MGFTRKAFIFSISNKEELDPFMSEVRRPDWAIHRWSWSGPWFGWDISIVNNANSNSNSYADLAWAYPAPAAVQDAKTTLVGTEYFSPDEVEVFYHFIVYGQKTCSYINILTTFKKMFFPMYISRQRRKSFFFSFFLDRL